MERWGRAGAKCAHRRSVHRCPVRTGWGLVGWAVFKLIQTGNIIPDALLDRSKLCDARIVKRVELFTSLRYPFYAVAYAALPMVSVLFFIKAGIERRRADIIGFALTFATLFYLYTSIYMKSPFLTYALLLACAAVVMRWWMVSPSRRRRGSRVRRLVSCPGLQRVNRGDAGTGPVVRRQRGASCTSAA